MYKKKLSLMALASLMILTQPLLAQETAAGAEAPATDPAASSDPLAPIEAAPTEQTQAAPTGDRDSAMQARWREREARYADLKQRAKEVGVMLPDEPPWKSAGMGRMPDMTERMQRHQAMMNMTPEERMAAREAHYEAMRERAKERGMELPETPPWEARQSAMDEEWAKHQAVIEGMSDEERAACHAMHRRHMGMMHREGSQRPRMQSPGMGRGMMGPGYGYGPGPYAPQNFWDPNR